MATWGCLTGVILDFLIFKTWLRNAKVNAGMQRRAQSLGFQLPLPKSHLRCCRELGRNVRGLWLSQQLRPNTALLIHSSWHQPGSLLAFPALVSVGPAHL